jgi:hypothetical protein
VPFIRLKNCPDEGTIFPYLGESRDIYRCPALEEGATKPTGMPSGDGIGSNGLYDYTTFSAWNAAKIDQIPGQATIARVKTDPTTHTDIITPLLIEEDPAHAANAHFDSQHAFDDRVGQWHNGEKGNFTAYDGSTAAFEGDGEEDNPDAQMWYAKAPNGLTRSLGHAQQSLEGPAPASATHIEFGWGEWGKTSR